MLHDISAESCSRGRFSSQNNRCNVSSRNCVELQRRGEIDYLTTLFHGINRVPVIQWIATA